MSRVAFSGQVRQRDPRQRDKQYLGWVATLPCVACACAGRMKLGVHVAHIRTGFPEAIGWRDVGKAEKPSDIRTAPLCPDHHLNGPNAQHRSNERAWWDRLRIHPPTFCSALVAAYEAGTPGQEVIRQAAAGKFCDAP